MKTYILLSYCFRYKQNTLFFIIIFFATFSFVGCEKEDSGTGDEPFVEPACSLGLRE